MKRRFVRAVDPALKAPVREADRWRGSGGTGRFHQRAADPYADTDVIDSRAPRFNQAVVGLLAALAVATGWWPILAVLAAQLAIGLAFGRRFCLPCLAYFELVQPVFGEGRLEDARPPRFANMVGVAFLTAASLAYVLGAPLVGAILGGLVAALALLAATTGFCAGCEAYKLGCWLRGEPFVSCPLPAPQALVREADQWKGPGETGRFPQREPQR